MCGQRKYFLCDLRDFGVSPLNFFASFRVFRGLHFRYFGGSLLVYIVLSDKRLELCHTGRLIPFLGEQYA